MTKIFKYELIECEERVWDNWEDFTQTQTADLISYLRNNPTEHLTVKIHFTYTSEGTTWLINGKWFPDAIHKFAHKYSIPYQILLSVVEVQTYRNLMMRGILYMHQTMIR